MLKVHVAPSEARHFPASHANKRLHRQGQAQKVIVHHPVADGGHDEDVIAALNDKGATQDRLIESLKARIGKAKETLQN